MPGLYDASLFNASLELGQSLADQLNVRRPTTYSQRDETGMTRSIVPLLAAKNISTSWLAIFGKRRSRCNIENVCTCIGSNWLCNDVNNECLSKTIHDTVSRISGHHTKR